MDSLTTTVPSKRVMRSKCPRSRTGKIFSAYFLSCGSPAAMRIWRLVRSGKGSEVSCVIGRSEDSENERVPRDM